MYGRHLLCSDGISTVGKYTDGRRDDVRIPFSVLNKAKFCSLWLGRFFKNSLIDCNKDKAMYDYRFTCKNVDAKPHNSQMIFIERNDCRTQWMCHLLSFIHFDWPNFAIAHSTLIPVLCDGRTNRKNLELILFVLTILLNYCVGYDLLWI